VRLAILLSLAALGQCLFPARADDALIRIVISARPAYIISESYAAAHKAEIIASLPGIDHVDGFWTPPEQDIDVADRVVRELVHSASKDPKSVFPDASDDPNASGTDSLAYLKTELELVSSNYTSYRRQYLGIILEGQKLVFCNYVAGPKLDPAAGFLAVEKVFREGNGVRFLQCRFEPWQKTASNLAIIGSWQGSNGQSH
jgi:hypothetical protein